MADGPVSVRLCEGLFGGSGRQVSSDSLPSSGGRLICLRRRPSEERAGSTVIACMMYSMKLGTAFCVLRFAFRSLLAGAMPTRRRMKNEQMNKRCERMLQKV